MAAGIRFGLVAPDTAEKATWLADAFVQVIQTVTGPVIFVTVVIGIASIGSLAKPGGLAVKALAYVFAMTVTALALGLIVGNSVATMVVAKWVGERDDERFQAALLDPEMVEAATERALRGGSREADEQLDGRFERKEKPELVLPGG